MEDKTLTLAEHLGELRGRLWKVVIAVLVLGGFALFRARDIFGLLMRPVLDALPPESRSLIYTSGIEELNVLLKVGLYAGLFLSTPVALYQLWMFIAPGLLKTERRLIGPFVGLGTLFFVGGALFCYLAVLPSMFQFLLTPVEVVPVRDRIAAARGHADASARLWASGDPERALSEARAAVQALEAPGEGRVPAPPVATPSSAELKDRLARAGRLIDYELGREGGNRLALGRAVGLHRDAEILLGSGSTRQAAMKLEEALDAVALVRPQERAAAVAVWGAQRHLASAGTQLNEEQWTRPMLSMREQLSLVLVLEIAFGLIFELPLIMAMLALAGVLKSRWVMRSQRYAVLACVAVAAIVTPTGDIVNLSLMAIPMVVCFELGAVLVWILERRRAPEAADAEQPVDGAARAG